MNRPILKKEDSLTEPLKAEVNALMSACLKDKDTGVPYPSDDEDCRHYLLWSDEGGASSPVLCGALAILNLSEESVECIAYVHPLYRRRGYFSRVLLPEALNDFPDREFCFPVRDGEKGVCAVLGSIGAEYDCTEYMMELDLNPSVCAGADLTDKYLYTLPDGTFPGECGIERISQDSVCLYNVWVYPEYRDQGHGKAMILSLTDELRNCGIRRVIVHVEKANTAAVSLYEKTGFRITEILSYYLL